MDKEPRSFELKINLRKNIKAIVILGAIILLVRIFSYFNIVEGATPNPGHPWDEIGDGLFSVTGLTSAHTFIFPNADATVLTTANVVTVPQGGTGVTSFLAGGIVVGNGTGALTVTTNPTVGYITATSTTATSTFANGIALSGGCFSVNGTCVGTGGVTSLSNSDGTLVISPTTADVVASLNLAHANTWSGVQTFSTLTKLIGQASTTQFSATSRIYVGSTATTTIVGDNGTSTFSGGIKATTSDLGLVVAGTWNGTTIGVGVGGTGLSTTPSYGQILVGTGSGYTLSATSSLGIALSDTTGTLPANRGGTGISAIIANQLLIGNGSGTGWSQVATSSLGLLTTNVNEGTNLYFTNARVNSYIDASTTIAKAYSANTFTNSNTFNGSLTFGSLTGILQGINGAVSASSTLSVAYGGTGLSTTPTYGQLLVGNTSGGYSLTATSSLGLLTTNVAEGSNLYYTDTRVNNYVAASSTIAKTYTANIFTALNTFNNGVAIGSLNGPLQANNGVVSATTSVGVLYGGTGLTSAPTFGQLLLGNSLGGYSLFATSSLGIALTDTTGILSAARGGTGLSTITSNQILIGNPGGTGWTQIATSSLGLLTTNVAEGSNLYFTNARVNSYVDASTTIAKAYSNNTFTGTNTFNNTLVLGSYNGPLQANNGVITSTTSIGVMYGGTGLANAPTYGQLLVGNSASGYTLVATSTLGVALSDTTGTLSANRGGTGISNPTAAGILVGSFTGGSWQQLATSSLGLLTTNVAEGSNLYFTNARVNSYVDASTTIAKAYSSNTFTASNIFNGGLTISSLNGPLQANNGVVSATSSIGVIYGGTGLTSAPTLGQILLGNSSGGYTLSATSSLGIALTDTTGILAANRGGTGLSSLTGNQLLIANAGGTGWTQVATSSLGLLTTNVAEGTNLYYTSARVNSFIDASTTIPKAYSSNTFSGTNTFNGTLALGSYNGPLQANNGTISATTSIGVLYGGTGLTSSPTYGQILVGNSASGYTLTSTSTLGIALSDTTGTLAANRGGTGISSISANQLLIGNSSGTGWTQSATSSLGLVTSVAASGGTTGLTFSGTPITTSGTLTLSGTLAVANGGTNITTPTSAGVLLGNYAGNGYMQIATSSLGLVTTNVNEGTNLYYTSARVNTFVDASTTIAKAYSTNTFTGANTFNGSLTIGTLNGPLQANNGVVSATSSVGVLYGGTGLSASPTYGQVLVGTSAGGYTLVATSTLNVALSNTTGVLDSSHGGTGISSVSANQLLIGNPSGTGWLQTGTSSLGLVTSVAASGGTTGLTFSGTPITTSGTLTLSGTLAVANGGTNITTPTAAGVLLGNYAGNGYMQIATSSLGLVTTNVNEGSNLYYTNARVNTFVDASTTIAKAYSANTFTNSNTFNGSLTFGSLTGILQGINGAVSASSTVSVAYGGTGLSTTPTYGQILVGNAANSYTLTATSSLGLLTTNVAEGTNLYFTNARVNSYIAGSTTIDKTYTANVFTALNTFNNGVTIGSLNGPLQANNGVVSATSSIGVIYGGTGLTSAPTFGQILVGNASNGYTLSATSSLGIALSDTTGVLAANRGGTGLSSLTGNQLLIANAGGTGWTQVATSSLGLLTTNVAEGTNLYYTDTRVNNYVAASTTIPKTYTSNTFTGAQTFNGTLALGSLNGPLQANNGTVSATTSIGVLYGGTGLTSSPTYGQILVGNSASGYTLTSTSTLGIALSDTTGTLAANRGGTGLSSVTANQLLIGNSSGTGWTQSATSSLGLVTSVAASGGTTGLSFSGSPITTSGTLTLSGTLAVANGGTNITTPTAAGVLLGNYAGTGYMQIATSSLGLLTTNVNEGSNLYYTSARVNSYIDASTTIAKAYSVNTFTNSNTFNGSLTIGSLTGILQGVNGAVSASSTVSVAYGGTGISTTPTYGQLLLGNASNGYTLTATSSLGLLTTNVAEGTNLYYTSARVNSYIDASSTIAKAYTANVFTALNTFNNGVTIGSLNGPLQANNGVVSATSSVGVLYGGTGLTASPSYGQILLGNASNGYTLSATSSLGIALSDTTGVLTSARGGTGISSVNANQLLIGNAGGSGWTQVATSSLGLLTTNVAEGTNLYYTSARVNSYIDASTTIAKAYSTNTFTGTNSFNGALNISTLTGVLQGINGAVSASSTVSVAYGGTGISTAPSFGQLLVGSATGGYTQTATSSLGLVTSVAASGGTTGLTFSGSPITTSGTLTLSGTLAVANGGTNITNPTAAGVLLGNYSGTGYMQLATSSLGLVTTNVNEGTNLYYTSARVNSYIDASTTIAKAYSNNTFTGSNTFNGALTIGSLNGPLQAKNGVVSATTSVGVLYGGTGLTSAPSYGQILVGNSASGYTLSATSSLGIALSDTTGTLAANRGGTGLSSVTANQLLIGNSSGTGWTQSATSSLGLVTSVAASGGTTGLTFSGTPITTSGTLTLSGTLAVANGGTNITTPTAAGVLLGNYAGTGYMQLATSSLGLLTTNVAEGSNLYYTDTRVANYINGSSTLPAALNYWTLNGGNVYRATGNVGIGTTTPGAKLQVLGTTEQLRLGYDASNYASFTTNSSGSLSVAVNGTNPNINFTTSGTGVINFNSNPASNGVAAAVYNNNWTLSNGAGQYAVPMAMYAPNIGSGNQVQTILGVSQSTNNDVGTTFAYVGNGASSNSYGWNFYGGSQVMTLQATGNVGIGSTTPTAALSVVGNAIFSNSASGGGQGLEIRTNNVITNSANPYIRVDSGGNLVIEPGASGKLYLNDDHASTNTLDINSGAFTVTGNYTNVQKLGIQTSTTATNFQVGAKVVDDNAFVYNPQTAYMVSQIPTSSTVLNDPQTVLLLARQGTGGQAYGAAAGFNISRYQNSGTDSKTRLDITLANQSFDVASNTIMTFLSSGKVGIGTTSPYSALAVAGQGTFDNIWATSTTATNYFAGNTGVGTTSPSGKFQVVGNTNGFSTDADNIVAGYANNLTQGFAMRYNGLYGVGSNTNVDINLVPKGSGSVDVTGVNTFLGGLRINGGDGSSNVIYQDPTIGISSGHDILFRTGSSLNNAMIISSAGNVGIGTSTPGTTFGVQGDSVIAGIETASRFVATSTTATSTFANGIALTGGCFYYNGGCLGAGGGAGTPGGSAGDIQYNGGGGSFGADSTFHFDTTNKFLGIGTSSPFAVLSVNAPAGKPEFAIGSSTKTNFIVSSSGNVGIGGNTSPQYAIDATGDLQLTHLVASGIGPRIILNNSAGYGEGAVDFYTIGGANSATDNPSARWHVVDDGNYSANMYLETKTPGGVGGSMNKQLAILSSGNVGIGTTTPYSRLAVAGQGTFDNIWATSTTATNYFAGNVGIGTTTTLAALTVSGGTTFSSLPGYGVASIGQISEVDGWSGSGFLFTNSNSGSKGFSMVYNADSAFFGQLTGTTSTIWQHWTSTGTYLGGGSNPANTLDVSGAEAIGTYAGTAAPSNGLIVSGKVGIGTNNPSYPLEVAGGTFVHTTGDGSAILTIGDDSSNGVTSEGKIAFSTGGTVIGNIGDSYNNGTYRMDFGANGVNSINMSILNNGNVGIGTTTPGTKLGVQGDSVIAGIETASRFVATSTTASVFPYASTTALTVSGTNGLSLGSLTGPLQAINGAVSASSTLSIAYGGTGVSTAPTFGQLLVGNSSGGYTLTATSSLGIPSSQWTTSGSNIYYNTGSVGIGTTTPFSKLSVTSASASATTSLFAVASSTKATLFNVLANGNVGVGSSSPSSLLAVANGGISVGYNPGSVSLGLQSEGITPVATLTDAQLTSAQRIAISGKYAYTLANGKLVILDITNATSPTIVGSVTAASGDIAVSGNYVYITGNSANSFMVIDVSVPSSPKVISTIVDSVRLNFAWGLYISGKYAYVTADSGSSMSVIDISNPSVPIIVGTVTDATNLNGPTDVYVQGKYAYVDVYAGKRLTVVDISNPTNPTVVGSLNDATNLNGAWSIAVSGKYAYVASLLANTVAVVDISNPLSPVLAGTVTHVSYLHNVNYMAVAGKYLYTINQGSPQYYLTVVDITNPAQPTLIAAYTLSNSGNGLAISGKYAYVNVSTNVFTVFDLGGIDSPGANIGNIASNNINVSENLDVGNSLNVHSNLNVGFGGIFSQGYGNFTAYASTSASSSYNYGALSSTLIDSNNSSLMDSFSLFHTATTSQVAANGIGTGLLFGAQDSTGFATSTSRIASILTNVTAATPASVLTFSNKNTNGALTEFMRLDQNGNLGIGTTTPGTKLGVQGDSVIAGIETASRFVATSTTVASTFPYASTTALTVSGANGLTLGSLTGPLQAINGAVTATSTLSIAYGGTGITSAPTYGQVLLGNASNGYTLTATSSLGFGWSNTASNLTYSGGNVGIGTTSPYATLTIAGTSNQTTPFLALAQTSTSNAFLQVASTTDFQVDGGVMTPTHAGSITNGTGGALLSFAHSVFVSGNYAYVVNNLGNSLEIVDVSNPKNPVHKGSITDGTGGAILSQSYSVFVSGNYAYVASSGGNALEIVDVSNPANPVHKGSLTNGTGGALLSTPQSVYVSGNYAYVASGNDLEIVDVSNPAHPVHKGSITDGTGGALLNGPVSVYVSGNYAYVASSGSNALEIVDVSNPAHPVHKGSLTNGTGGALLNVPFSVYVSGNYAYIAAYSNNALEIVDVSNPANPVHKGSLTNGGSASLSLPYSVYVSGNYAYIAADGSNALEIVDVSNPASPIHKGSISNFTDSKMVTPISVYVSGNYAYVLTNSNTLDIVDIGGMNVSNAQIGTLSVGNLQISGTTQFNNDAYFKSGLNIGTNALVNGALTISGNMGSTSLINSPSLNAGIADTNTSSIVDVANLFHTSTSSQAAASASGIGTGLLFSNQDSTGLATSTSRIASILTNVTASTPASVLTFSNKNTNGSLTEFMRLDQNGNLGIGTTSPGSLLSIGTTNGINFSTATSTFNSTGGINLTAGCFAVNGTCLSSGTPSQWTTLGSNIYYPTGFVGIGTTTPAANLSVAGNAYFDSTTITFASTTAKSILTMNFATSTALIVPNNLDNIFSISTSTANQPIFSVSTKNSPMGLIGIGTSSPWAKLALEMGTLNPAVAISNQGSSSPSLVVTGVNQNGLVGIGTTSPFAALSIQSSGSKGFGSLTPLFAIGSTTTNATTMIVDQNGRFGVGTSSPGFFIDFSSAARFRLAAATSSSLELPSVDIGPGLPGQILTVGRNTDTTNGAGSVDLVNRAGTNEYIWVDSAGNMRVNTVAPSNANDLLGTVVGAQTSVRSTKQDITDYTNYDDALQTIAGAPLHYFRYINEVQGYGSTSPLAKTRIGFIADEVSPQFMQGNIIDQVSVNGLLMASVKALNSRINSKAVTDLAPGISMTDTDTFGRAVLTTLLTQPATSTATSTSIYTNTLAAGLEVVTPHVYTQGLTVDSISPRDKQIALNGDVVFFGRPYFTTDTAGFATIQQGSRRVDITFDKDYIEQPIVNASISLEAASSTDSFTQADALFTNGVQYVVTNKTTHGFSILINKSAAQDIKFSWTAFAVNGPKNFLSTGATPQDQQAPVLQNTQPQNNSGTTGTNAGSTGTGSGVITSSGTSTPASSDISSSSTTTSTSTQTVSSGSTSTPVNSSTTPSGNTTSDTSGTTNSSSSSTSTDTSSSSSTPAPSSTNTTPDTSAPTTVSDTSSAPASGSPTS